MKLLSKATDGAWQSLAAAPGDETSSELIKARRASITATLTDVLFAQNLVVLCGLGTSLCVKSGEGAVLAPTMENLWDDVEQAVGAKTMSEVAAAVRFPNGAGKNIELLLSHCQLSEVFAPSKATAEFISSAERIIIERCRFVAEEVQLPVHATFLRKCARRGHRLGRLRVFTTNYDLCFETAASRTRFIAIDGFSHSPPHSFDGQYFTYDYVRRTADNEAPVYLPNVFHLYKLHGSVDWEAGADEIRKSPTPAKPLIIYPRVGKFEASYEQPFLELMSKFQSEVREPNTGIVVVGSGLRDKHVAQPLMAAVRANVNARIVVVDPTLSESTEPVIVELTDLVRRGDSRVTLLATTFEDFVTLLPDLVPPTEQEQHVQRLADINKV